MSTHKQSSPTGTRSYQRSLHWITTLLLGMLFSFASISFAAPQPEVGSVVALKGKAVIERSGKKVDAKIKAKLQLADTVQTGAGSRLKMLFVDDSVLTLSNNSRMAIKEFVHSKGDRGKSIFNLLDGKMRAVVGKTRFEVQTPTAVAAARGTVIYFETGILDGKHFTKIICLEGTVDVQGVGAAAGTSIPLTAGNQIMIMENEPLPQPTATPQNVIEQIRKENASKTSGEVRLTTPQLPEGMTSGLVTVDVPYIIPMVDQQQPQVHQPTSVVIGIGLNNTPPPVPTGATGGTSGGTTLR